MDSGVTTKAGVKSGGRARAAVASDRVLLFQSYFLIEQRPFLDPSFEALDGQGQAGDLAELLILIEQEAQAVQRKSKAWGVFDWQFGERTGLTAHAIQRAISSNPGFDVWFVNPEVYGEALFHNAWQQPQLSHPGFGELCHHFFRAAQLPLELVSAVQSPSTYAASHYIVGTPAFWKRYLAFLGTLISKVEARLDDPVASLLRRPLSSPGARHSDLSVMSLILERLMPVFLSLDAGRDLRVCKIACERSGSAQDVHERLLGEMRMVACQTKSKFLVNCWLNYRNLYLSALRGENWAQTYLKALTPTSVGFALNEPAVALAGVMQGQTQAVSSGEFK